MWIVHRLFNNNKCNYKKISKKKITKSINKMYWIEFWNKIYNKQNNNMKIILKMSYHKKMINNKKINNYNIMMKK